MVMLAAPKPAPPPDPIPPATVVQAQVALKRFLATGKVPLYLRQGVAPLMAYKAS